MKIKNLELLKIRTPKRNNLLFLSLSSLLILAPEMAFAVVLQDPINIFNDSLSNAATGMGRTVQIVIIIVKYIAFLGSIIGLITFLVTRSGDNDISGKAGKWGIGLLLFTVGLHAAQKVFGIS